MMFIQMINWGKCLILSSLIFLCNCNNHSEENETDKALTGDLTKITLDHVVEKREGCRFTTFYFELILKNKTDREQQIEITPTPDHCERDISESKIWWVKGTEKKPLTLASSKYDKVVTVKANDQEKVELKGVFRVQGENLNQITSIYEDWFESGKVVYQRNEVVIRKAKDFKLVFLLDNEQVTPSDSTAFNKNTPLPSLKADTLLDKSQIPTTEPELK